MKTMHPPLHRFSVCPGRFLRKVSAGLRSSTRLVRNVLLSLILIPAAAQVPSSSYVVLVVLENHSLAYGHQNALRTILDALEIDDHLGVSATADPKEDFFVMAAPNPHLSTASLHFGSQLLNTPASNTVTLSNRGSSPLAISSITTAGSDFTETNTCGKTLDRRSSCTVTVTFKPTALGPRAGQLIFTGSAPLAQIVVLSGTGAAMDFSPLSLVFGDQVVGTSSAQTLTIKNTTNGAGTISAVSVSAGFFENNDCVILDPGASCRVNVVFAPTAAGAAIGTVTISSGGTQATVPVSGIGTDFSIGLQSASSFSATVTGGQTALYNLAAIGSAGFTGSLSISCNGEPNASSCVSNPRTVTLSGGIPGNFSVSIPTTVRGEASLSFDPRLFLPALAVVLTVSLALVMSTLVGLRRLIGLAILVLTCALLAGCGEAASSNAGSPGVTGTPAGTYTVVVTASSGSVSRTVKLTLVVN